MGSSVRAQSLTEVGRRATAALAVMALVLVGLTLSARTAQAADYRVNLRVLVVTNGNPSEQAIAVQLQREGVPYTLVDTRTAGRPTIDNAFLTTAGGATARYQAVVLPDQAGTGLAAAELTALSIYESSYGVRQVNAYSFPGPSMGLQNDEAHPVFSGFLDGGTATVTAAGLSGPFKYLNGTVPVDNFDAVVNEVPVYLAQPLSPLPAGETFTPLMTATVGTNSGVLAGVHTKDGREELVLTAAYNDSQQWFNEIAHGIVSWATRGINLGANRAYFAVHVDDVFLPDSRWSVLGDCTPGDDCAAGTNFTTTDIRMTPADVDSLIAWQNANNFKLDMVYNGGGSAVWNEYLYPDLPPAESAVIPDPLLEKFLATETQFPWINHTFTHPFLGCIQIAPTVVGQKWHCQTLAGEQPLQDESIPGTLDAGVYWASQDFVRDQLINNITWATGKLTDFDPTELVTGEHSGLLTTPQQPVDNPFLDDALTAAGVLYTGSDTSREPLPRKVGTAATMTVPRYPMNIYYNAGTYQDQIDEYNWYYAPQSQGGGGICEANSATSTCMSAPLPAGTNAEAKTSYDNYLKPLEIRNALKRVMTNDPRPFYAHQSNLAEDGILYPVVEGTLSQYRATHATTAPIVRTDMRTQYETLTRMAAWQAASGSVDAYIDSTGVHVAGGSNRVPLTMPAGSTATGVSLESYGGELSGWGTGTITATPLTPMGGYVGNAVTAPPAPTITAVSGGVATATVTWAPPATNGGTPITGYSVSIYQGDSPTALKTLPADALATSLTFPDLINGTPYTFTVAAQNAIGPGPSSARSLSATPKALPPAAPTGVTVVAGNASATVSWTAPAGATDITRYQVTAHRDDQPNNPVIAYVAAPATSVVVPGLTNGIWYGFDVAAENTGGFGAATSPWIPALVYTVPDAPTNLTTLIGDGQVQLNWDPPASVGGYPFDAFGTYYRVTTYQGTTVVGTPQDTASWVRTATVTGLTNGLSYTFQVVAGNPAGAGAAATTPAVTPLAPPTVPGAPTITTVAPGDASATITWVAPVDDVRSPITGYEIQAYDGTTAVGAPVLASATATSGTVIGLVNGTPYTFTVAVRNALGATASAPFGPVTPEKPVTPPGAPTGVTATASDGKATVTWTAPESDGGSPVTGYVVTPSPNGTPVTVTDAGTSTEVTGLTNGTPYTFTVAAVNAKGTGNQSASSAAVTPTEAPKVPDAPSITSVTAGNTSVALAWQAPVKDNGSAIIGYTVTVFEGTSTTGTPIDVGLVTSKTIDGLTNGTSYRFTVAAVNGVGMGAAVETAAVTPAAPPTAPTGVQATAGAASATVTWTPPADGGSAITGYVVRGFPAGGGSPVSQTAAGDATSAGLTGLANGTAYTFTVTATNLAGPGPESDPSNSVTPVDVPGAPASVTAIAGNGTAKVTWSAPATDGGSPISAYRVSVFPAGATAPIEVSVGDVRSVDVPGLANGTAYTFSVAAINGVGTGPESQRSTGVTPATTPAAPQIGTATAADGSATLTWTPPTDNGGSAVTGYRISVVAGDASTPPTVAPASATSAGVRNLANGTTYSFTVAAVNAVGVGTESAGSNEVTPAAATAPPGAPASVTATEGPSSVTLTWTDSGAEATGYVIRTFAAGSTTSTDTEIDGPSTITTVTGLTNGTAYEFTVTAKNSAGPSDESSRSNAVTPRTTPGVPTNVEATAGIGSATVTWTPPTDTGGAGITEYEVRAWADGATAPTVFPTGAVTSTVVDGLTVGSSYTFAVVAKNAAGWGTPSDRSNTVTPIPAPTAPGVPTAVSATAGDAAVTLTWEAPSSNGGADVQGYEVVTYRGSTPVDTAQVTVTGTTASVTGLVNGTVYTFTVAARNSVGLGDPSAPSNEVTPIPAPTAPGVPTAVSATAEDASATVMWTVPESDGGSPITGYVVTTYLGETVVTDASVVVDGTSAVVTGLTNGTGYSFTVAAINAIDTGVASQRSNEVTPRPATTAPGAPTAVAATAGDSSAMVTWTAPDSDGGSPITGYVVRLFQGQAAEALRLVTVGGAVTTATMTGLTNGTAYTFTVTAGNAAGNGTPSAASDAVTPVALPGAPTIDSSIGGDGSVSLTWITPDDGGSTIIRYLVTTYQGGSADGVPLEVAGNGVVVEGLTNGRSYTFTVIAVNGVGDGPASQPSSVVTPAAKPGPPTDVSATAADASATVTWSAPGSDNGSPITGYVVTTYQGETAVTDAVAVVDGTSAAVTGLRNGTVYTFSVAAINAVGTGSPSQRSDEVTPRTTPGAPAIGTATSGAGTASISWTAPADGGSPITGYEVRLFEGQATQALRTVTIESTVTTASMTGLTNGTAYTFTVTAQNALGTGPESERSNSVTPATVPGAPRIGTAIAGEEWATVNWRAPLSDGGSAITGYVVSVFTANGTEVLGTVPAGATATSVVVPDLTHGVAYRFRVTAVNAAGTGPASARSSSATPVSYADAPTIGTATSDDRSATVTWTAPEDNGGTPITAYVVRVFAGGSTQELRSVTVGRSARSRTISNLVNGTSYQFSVAAVNAFGEGDESALSNSVIPATVAAAPVLVTATAANAAATVSWRAPARTGGAPITGYVVSILGNTGTAVLRTVTISGATTSATVTGLSNGTGYRLRVAAVNAAGKGAACAPSRIVTPRP